MADLSIDFCGVRSPNPFWVASGPPANTAYQAHRAFEAGWGGVVWKTIGEPIVNTASRYSAMHLPGSRMAGFNNIELISDRAPETNFREIKEVKDPDTNAQLVAENIAVQLTRRVSFRRALKRSVQVAMDMGAEGIKVTVSGRLNGAEMSRTETYKDGRIPLHTFRADIDFAISEAHTPKRAISG